MPNSREIKMLMQPLLKRRPDLAVSRRMLFFKPLRHYLRGIVFISSMYSKDFEIQSFAVQLFTDWEHSEPDWDGGHRQYRYCIEEEWTKNPEAASQALCDRIEREALPPVEPIVTPSAHEARPNYMYLLGSLDGGEADSPNFIGRTVHGACFNGDYDRAERLAAPYVAEYLARAGSFQAQSVIAMARLLEHLRTDRARIPALLHEWEARQVAALKLEKFWAASPFPCEGGKPE